MKKEKLSIYRWNGDQWSSTTDVDMKYEVRSKVNVEGIRLATFNILADCFPWFVEVSIQSEKRYAWLCQAIERFNPTIIGFNEVTENALRILQESSFIRENYFISESIGDSMTNARLSPHGCLILSQIPLMEVHSLETTGSRRAAIIAKIQLDDNADSVVNICSQHTTAYQTAKNAALRSQQIRDIVQVVEDDQRPYIIMGDLNLHYLDEDKIILEHGFIDAWTQTHFSGKTLFDDRDPGFTFDANRNPMIAYYIPGETRRMRLDRILFSSNFPGFAREPCQLWANQPIEQDKYLFPSDHFGLYIDFMFARGIDDENRTISLSSLDPSARSVLEENASKCDRQQSLERGLVRRTLALGSHVFWLCAVLLGLK